MRVRVRLRLRLRLRVRARVRLRLRVRARVRLRVRLRVYRGALPSELAPVNACVSSSYTWPSVKPVYSTSSAAHVGKKVSAEAPFLFPLPGYG